MIVQVNSEGYTVETKFKYPVKIGEGGIEKKVITPKAWKRAIAALSFFKEKIISYKATLVYATATSAFRNAENSDALRKEILETTGIHIDVISGDREAELIYKGVKSAMRLEVGPQLIMDIGGGSVEFILCDHDEMFWKQSFEIGAQRLLDKFQHHDPILPEEIKALNAYLEIQLQPLFDAWKQHPTRTLIGSSGTFDTVSEIYFQQEHIPININSEPSWEIPMRAFHHAHQEFISKHKEERLDIPGMVPMRVDMIVVASCLIDFIVEKFSINRIRVSAYALKEGLLSELIS